MILYNYCTSCFQYYGDQGNILFLGGGKLCKNGRTITITETGICIIAEVPDIDLIEIQAAREAWYRIIRDGLPLILDLSETKYVEVIVISTIIDYQNRAEMRDQKFA